MHKMRVNLVAVYRIPGEKKTFMEECALTCAMLACKVNTLTPSYCAQYISYENKF